TGQSAINLVATNVPGPQAPFYTGGAQLLEFWPLVAIYHSLGLNVAIVSYNGSVHFGMLADRDLVPDLDDFAKHLERSASVCEPAATKRPRASPPPRGSLRDPGELPRLRRGGPSGVGRRGSAACRATPQQPAQEPVDLGVANQTVVAAPNGDRGDVRTDAAAEVD